MRREDVGAAFAAQWFTAILLQPWLFDEHKRSTEVTFVSEWRNWPSSWYSLILPIVFGKLATAAHHKITTTLMMVAGAGRITETEKNAALRTQTDLRIWPSIVGLPNRWCRVVTLRWTSSLSTTLGRPLLFAGNKTKCTDLRVWPNTAGLPNRWCRVVTLRGTSSLSTTLGRPLLFAGNETP